MHEAEPGAFPAVDELNRMSPDAFRAALGPLVEGAPHFLDRLAEARPFTSAAAMLDAMHAVASEMPEPEQIELLDAHPRIGADPTEMSGLSYDEQGYAAEAADDAEQLAYLSEELANLNELYEGRFGFRYVVFVAGRPKAAIVELMEHALRNDRAAELRRGVHDAIYIAGDRLNRLRGGSEEEAEGEA
jgi:2-oxo-4-hydroxy-4-carboxy--5-ureidoimidazoline (OHCU) decarboxylase